MADSPQHFLIATPAALQEIAVDVGTLAIVQKQSTPLTGRLTALCLSPDHRRVYATMESSPDHAAHTGRLLTWNRSADGSSLEPLGSQPPPSTQGVTPCYLVHHPRHQLLAVTHFRGPGDRDASAGSVALFALDAEGNPSALRSRLTFPGSGPVLPRQATSHPHCAVFTTSPDMLHVADLGTDSVWSIPLDFEGPELCGTPVRYTSEPGSGPRHLAVVQNGHALLLVTEMNNSLQWLQPVTGETTTLSLVAEVSLLPHFTALAAAADVQVSHDSRFVYASLRQLDDVATFALDLSAQTLTPASRMSSIGVGPRWITLSHSDGSLLAIANTGGPSSSLDFLRRDPTTGHLERTALSIPGAYLSAAVPA